MMEKREFNIFLIFFTFIIMLCINHYRNNVFLQPSVSKNLENTFKLGDISGIQTDRILAKHEVKKNTKHCKLREQKFANGKNMRTKNEEDKTQTYKNTKKEVLSELDTYMRSYVSRYEKRKGLENLDCFCEKKVFDIIDKIDKARKSNNKKLKKKLHLKYRFCFVTTCLIPFLGLIFPILDNIKFNTTTSGSTGSCKSILCAAGISVPVYYIYIIFFLILAYIILAFIIYIMIKYAKYEKLKGKQCKTFFNYYFG